ACRRPFSEIELCEIRLWRTRVSGLRQPPDSQTIMPRHSPFHFPREIVIEFIPVEFSGSTFPSLFTTFFLLRNGVPIHLRQSAVPARSTDCQPVSSNLAARLTSICTSTTLPGGNEKCRESAIEFIFANFRADRRHRPKYHLLHPCRFV